MALLVRFPLGIGSQSINIILQTITMADDFSHTCTASFFTLAARSYFQLRTKLKKKIAKITIIPYMKSPESCNKGLNTGSKKKQAETSPGSGQREQCVRLKVIGMNTVVRSDLA